MSWISTANQRSQLRLMKENQSTGGRKVFVGRLDPGWRQHLYTLEDLGNVNVANSIRTIPL